ncbi:MAG: hypothetical protein ACLFNQ_02300 [Spirochaetaceae bacterium]
MNVSGSWASIQITPATLIGARFDHGKVSFPVAGTSGYASFDHVRGIPSSEEGHGYSVGRLQIINRILERFMAAESPVSGTTVEEASRRLAERLNNSVYGSAYGNYLAGESLTLSA